MISPFINVLQNCEKDSSQNRIRVGFCQFRLFDVTRKEQFGKNTNRQFEVLAWYPGIAVKKARRKEYLSGRDVRKLFFLKIRFRNRVAEIESKFLTKSFIEIPVSDYQDRYPVLFFSHDVGMLPEYYSRLMERLAGEGYFVFSINHPHVSESCSIVEVDANRKKNVSASKWTALVAAFLAFKTRRALVGKSYTEKWTLSKKLLKDWNSFAGVSLDLADDKAFLLTFLEQLNTKFFNTSSPYSIFSNRLDLSRIGVLGHGWGGASAVTSLFRDRRFSAAVNLDGFQFDNFVTTNISKPLLMIYSEENSGINDGIYFTTADFQSVTINESSHESFTDWPHYNPKKNEENNKVLGETLERMLSFLNRHVRKVDYFPPAQAVGK